MILGAGGTVVNEKGESPALVEHTFMGKRWIINKLTGITVSGGSESALRKVYDTQQKIYDEIKSNKEVVPNILALDTSFMEDNFSPDRDNWSALLIHSYIV